MSIDLTNGYSDLRRHVGHAIECVTYGGSYEHQGDDSVQDTAESEVTPPQNVALECVDCSEVLIDFDFDQPEED